MSKPLFFTLESPVWLNQIRWVAIFFFTCLAVLGEVAGVQFSAWGIYGSLALYATWNFFFLRIEPYFPGGLQEFISFQVFVDLGALTFLLWKSGGLSNPFASFYLLEVLVAGLLLGPVLTMISAAASSVCIVVLAFAPPLLVNGQIVSFRDSPLWLARPVSLLVLIAITTGFILAFLRRLGRAEEDLLFRTKMDALGRMVAGLAHEIGTPPNSILLIAQEAAESARAPLRQKLLTVAGEARRCGEVVSQLLGYSRSLVRLNSDLEYTEVSAGQWINDIYRGIPLSSHSRPAFTVTHPGLPDTFAIPTSRMRQVLENLLKNAIYAVRNEKNQQITVKIYRDLVENDLVFEVADNGPGFSPEEKERAFEAFFSTKTQELSPGLGLYMSYYPVDQMCGRIVIAEHSGRGAILRVSLPVAEGLDDQAAVA